ncbi:EamA family transporter [Thaumasiovibrio subtropicus]|uniref:EamA family transporter n=1 Tax=Thaumasiovibrio subtropicus TaxID=1891207 RepID=UPI000B35533A|nr:EamA family transporter [Thaumasiovibrio subtropicus]
MDKRDSMLAVLVMAVWGFNFVMIKLAATAVNPLMMTAARFALAVFPLVFFIPRPQVQWRYLVAYGVVFGVGVWGMASWSITVGLGAGVSSVLLQTNVLFGIIIGVLFYKDTLTAQKLLGSILAVSGLGVLLIATQGEFSYFGLVLIAVSAMCWTASGMIVKASGVKQAFAFNIWGMLFAPLPLILFAVGIHGGEVIAETVNLWRLDTTVAVLFQAYPTTLFGYWVWNKLLLKYPFSTVSPLTLLTSVFGLLSGYLILGEALNTLQTLACVLFLGGILSIILPSSLFARVTGMLKSV